MSPDPELNFVINPDVFKAKFVTTWVCIEFLSPDENKRRDATAAAAVAGHGAVRHPELFGTRRAVVDIPPTWVLATRFALTK